MIGNKQDAEAAGTVLQFGRRALYSAMKAYRKERWSVYK